LEEDDARGWADQLGARLSIDGWQVRRIKLEAALSTESKAQYWEAHYKFRYVKHGKHELNEFVQASTTPEEWLQSRNLYDRQVHYLTLRHYSSNPKWDSSVASGRFATGWERIKGAKLPIVSAHFETVIFDSFPEFDKGWA
jgi:hypothetical protein